MMKRIAAMLLCLILALALCACGGAAESTVSEKPANMESTLPELTTEEEPAETAAPVSDKESAAEEAVQKALKLKDRPVSELYDAVGEPDSEESSPSCMGPGEDVMLYYDGFSVFTYKEGSSQVVKDAWVEK